MKRIKEFFSGIGMWYSYVVLAIIPMLLCLFIFQRNTVLVRSAILSQDEVLMIHTGEMVESALSSANQLALLISDQVKALPKSYKDKTERIYTILKTMQSLPISVDSNGLIEDYFIIDFENNFIIRPRVGYLSARDYFEIYVSSNVNEYQEWANNLRSTGVFSLKGFASENGNYMYYCYPVISLQILQPTRVVVFVFSGRKTQELIVPFLENGTSQLILSYNSDDMISLAGESSNNSSSLAENRSGSGQREIVTDWRGQMVKLTSVIPDRVVYSRVFKSMRSIIALTASSYLLELLLIVYIVRRNQKPVKRIVSVLNEHTDMNQDAGMNLDSIQKAVGRLGTRIDSLNDRVSILSDNLRTTYQDRILNGDIDLSEGIHDYLMPLSNNKTDDSLIRGIIMCFAAPEHPTDSIEHLRAEVVRILERFLPEIQFISHNHDESMNLIYVSAPDHEMNYRSVLSEINQIVEQDMNMQVVFYVGFPVRRFENVFESFAASRSLIQRSSFNKKTIIYVSDQAKNSNALRLNYVDMSKKLNNLLDNGDPEEVRHYIVEIYQKCIMEQVESFEKQLLYYSILGVLTSVKNRQPLPAELRYSVSSMSAEQFFSLVTRQCEMICQTNRNQMRQQEDQLITRIIDYINDHCMDKEISLTMMRYQFGMSETSLSLLIKDEIGEPFSVHVEKLRIAEAEKLLRETDMSIEAIADQVGYFSGNTFRRAFRRVLGISPTKYRSQ